MRDYILKIFYNLKHSFYIKPMYVNMVNRTGLVVFPLYIWIWVFSWVIQNCLYYSNKSFLYTLIYWIRHEVSCVFIVEKWYVWSIKRELAVTFMMTDLTETLIFVLLHISMHQESVFQWLLFVWSLLKSSSVKCLCWSFVESWLIRNHTTFIFIYPNCY